MIIDIHIHHYPPEILKDPPTWAAQWGENHWGSVVESRARDGASLQGWSTTEELLRDMDCAGVDRVVMQGWYWQQSKSCDMHNAWHCRSVEEHPDRFLAFAAVQPLGGDTAFDALRRAVDGGCCGIGEVLPAAQGFDLRDPNWRRMLDYADINGLPVCMHVTEPVGRAYPSRVGVDLQQIVEMAGEFPRLKLILAHWGGGLPLYELNPWCRKRLKGVYYDTAASPLIYDTRVWKQMTDLAGHERVLFGSDYPLRLYPSREKTTGFRRLIKEVRESGTTKSAQDRILGLNAAALLGL